VGEVMTSRWAYEAIAVHQFKNNAFEKEFYELDQTFKKIEFRKNYWLGKLTAKLSSAQNNFGKEDKKELIENNLTVLHNEITKELKRNPHVEFNLVNNLYIDKLNDQVFDETKNYLAQLNEFYLKKYKKAYDEKDALTAKLNKDKEAKEKYIQMKNDYTNDALSDYVKDKNSINKILELDGHLIQKADPIYMNPSSFRSHFYAPQKRVFGKYFDTFWVNIIVIWIMCVILGITLYFDILRKGIEGIGKIFEKSKY
jgi:hypothetical protein